MKTLKRLLFIPLFLFSYSNSFAQNCPTVDTLFETCSEAGQFTNLIGDLDTLTCWTVPDSNIQDIPPIFCGSIENNGWLAFVAGSESLEIGVEVFDCFIGDGLQGQIYSDCEELIPVSNCWNPATQTNGTLNAANLTIGQVYYLMLDGWAGDLCHFNINILEGFTLPPVFEAPDMLIGPTAICPMDTVTFQVVPVVGADGYIWEVPVGADLLSQNENEITVAWGITSGNICMSAYNESDTTQTLCTFITTSIPDTLTQTDTICEGEIFVFFGRILSAEGTYQQFEYVGGECNTLHILHLAVLPDIIENLEATICEGESYLFEGNSYEEEGIYSVTYSAQSGCDSILVLDLEVLDTFFQTTSVTICKNDSIEFEGSFYEETGIYSVTYLDMNGCDSTLELQLEVVDSFDIHLQASICEGESYEFEGEIYTEAGEYSVTYPASTGCDSMLVLELNVNPKYAIEIDTAVFSGTVFNDVVIESDTTIELLYTTQAGCDSTITYQFSIIVGTSTVSKEGKVFIFPNPFNQKIIIEWTELGEPIDKIIVYDAFGRLVREEIVALDHLSKRQGRYEIELGQLASGLYWVHVVMWKERLIKGVVKK